MAKPQNLDLFGLGDDERPLPSKPMPRTPPSEEGFSFEDWISDTPKVLNPRKLLKPWMEDVKFVLGTEANLTSIIDQCIASGLYALDVEATGLDNRVKNMGGIKRTVDHIVGVCLSPNDSVGYYVPIRHVVVDDNGDPAPAPCNVPFKFFDQEFRRLIKATEDGKAVAVFHNAKYDHEMLQFNETGVPWGTWESTKCWADTMIMVYLRNSRTRRKGLKELAETPPDAKEDVSPVGGPGLGMPMIHLCELWGHEKPIKGFKYDFSQLNVTDDSPALWYGCSDAIITRRAHQMLAPVLEPDTDGKDQGLIYTIEKGCVTATRWMERNRIYRDLDKVRDLVKYGQQEWIDSIKDVYVEASKILGRNVMPPAYDYLIQHFVADDIHHLYRDQMEIAGVETASVPHPPAIQKAGKTWPAEYDINAPAQLGLMFDEMEVPGLKRTEKSGQIQTSKDELKRIIEESGSDFPFMSKIRRFREIAKGLSTYLEPMLLDADEEGLMRISFNGFSVDTGRFSTPAREGAAERQGVRKGFPELNVQATPNAADKSRPATLTRIRECFGVRPSGRTYQKPRTDLEPEGVLAAIPRFFVGVDYAGVELRLSTNLSREPKWLTEFFRCSACERVFDQSPRDSRTKTPLPPPARCPNCGSDKIGDLHTLTTLSIYGADSAKRPDWKKLRGNGKATNFALSYGGSGNAVVRATGVDPNEGARIKSTFDRTYTGLKTWWAGQHAYARKYGYVRTAFGRKYPLPDINHPDGMFRSKAERNAINGPIQGVSADVTKMAMALIYKECAKRGWLDKCQMVITMHDELCFEIDADILEDALEVIHDQMVNNQILLSRNWPVPLTTDIELGYDWTVPWAINDIRYQEVRFIGNKKYKDAASLPPGIEWDSLHSWPEDLEPWIPRLIGQIKGAAAEPALKEKNPSRGGSYATPGTFKVQLSEPLGPSLAFRISEAIIKALDPEGEKPMLMTLEGTPLMGWDKDTPGIKVNQEIFMKALFGEAE